MPTQVVIRGPKHAGRGVVMVQEVEANGIRPVSATKSPVIIEHGQEREFWLGDSNRVLLVSEHQQAQQPSSVARVGNQTPGSQRSSASMDPQRERELANGGAQVNPPPTHDKPQAPPPPPEVATKKRRKR